MARLRILVLTSSTGGGHDARAEAFAEWCFQLYRHEIDVRIEQMLEKSSVVNRAGVNFYNWIQQKSPWVHKAFYTVVEGLSFLNSRKVTFGRGYYVKVLREFKPHLVLSVHDCLNRGYFQEARAVLGPARVRCATYCGEFSGGWGYSRNWVEPSVDLYISRTAAARDFAVKIGMPAARTVVRGSLRLPSSHLDLIAPEERGPQRARQLGLRPDLFTVFLATGGNGANNHFDLLPVLERRSDRCQAIVICGKNKEVFNRVIQWRANHPDFNCHVEGYSEQVPRLMQLSDLIVTRGGTTTCAKALHLGCPIVFNAFGGIMPQERLTWKYFNKGAGCVKIESAADFEVLMDRWLDAPASYEEARDAFQRLRYHEDPTVVIDELVELAREAAGVGPLRRWAFPPPPEER
ncbi:glycosyltransferase [Horticoccus luteus]|uniref:Glycosyltransferase n=1 Tax=Horticoccus luteus TaxID=2862869 RepID=A0A8F9XI15_9BACT|nr:glycosyltransferase [Horticoccus luteus]QYM79945.1 glycosyltransferase [Horticoccus luteus]